MICISLIISDAEHLLHEPVGHLSVFFEEMSIQVSAHFLIGLFVLFDIQLYELFAHLGT